jgi:hypothetical protein
LFQNVSAKEQDLINLIGGFGCVRINESFFLMSSPSSSNTRGHSNNRSALSKSSTSNIAPDSYEIAVRNEIKISIWNNNLGLPLSQAYTDARSNRAFRLHGGTHKADRLAFQRTRQILKRNHWDELDYGSIDFKELEADVLLHAGPRADVQVPVFDGRMHKFHMKFRFLFQGEKVSF